MPMTTYTSVNSSSLVQPLTWTRLLVMILQVFGFAILTAICAERIPLPFTPVPITLQVLPVLLSGALLGPWRGAASQVLLIVLGALGFGVFADRAPGYITLMGPTGGYILGFIFASFITGWMFRHLQLRSFLAKFLHLFVASLFILIPGVLWLKVFTGASMGKALAMGLYPFLLWDVLKTAATALFMEGFDRNSTK